MFTVPSKRRIRRISERLDLGCGHKCREGFTGIDIREHGQDILWDIRDGIPVPNASVTHLWSSHFIEHLSIAESGILFDEIQRIMKPGGLVEIRCPQSQSQEAWFHNHFSPWSPTRVKGIVQGYAGSTKPGENYFAITQLDVVGMELQFKLIVKVK